MEELVKPPVKPETPALDVKDIAPALQGLAKAIEGVPTRLASEVELARAAFFSGCGLGVIVGVLLVCILILGLGRRQP